MSHNSSDIQFSLKIFKSATSTKKNTSASCEHMGKFNGN